MAWWIAAGRNTPPGRKAVYHRTHTTNLHIHRWMTHTPLKIMINQIIFSLLWYLCSTNIESFVLVIMKLCICKDASCSNWILELWLGEGTCSSVCNTINLSFYVSGQPLLRSLVLWLQLTWTQMTWIWKSSVRRYLCSTEIFRAPQQSPTCGTWAFNLMIRDLSDSLRVCVLPQLSLIHLSVLHNQFSSQAAILLHQLLSQMLGQQDWAFTGPSLRHHEGGAAARCLPVYPSHPILFVSLKAACSSCKEDSGEGDFPVCFCLPSLLLLYGITFVRVRQVSISCWGLFARVGEWWRTADEDLPMSEGHFCWECAGICMIWEFTGSGLWPHYPGDHVKSAQKQKRLLGEYCFCSSNRGGGCQRKRTFMCWFTLLTFINSLC